MDKKIMLLSAMVALIPILVFAQMIFVQKQQSASQHKVRGYSVTFTKSETTFRKGDTVLKRCPNPHGFGMQGVINEYFVMSIGKYPVHITNELIPSWDNQHFDSVSVFIDFLCQ